MSNPLKVYVAGAAVEMKDRAVPVIQALKSKQIRGERLVAITLDWTRNVQLNDEATSDVLISDIRREAVARADLRAVAEADYVLLLAPHDRGASGAWTEYGYALGRGVPVIVAGPKRRRTIFTQLAAHQFTSDDEAVAFVTRVATAHWEQHK